MPSKAASDLPVDWICAFRRLDGAYSEITLRGYRSDFGLFEAWCTAEGHVAAPAAAETVAAYIEALTDMRAPATIRRRVAAIGRIHRLLELDGPSGTQTVVLAMRRMYRKRGRRQRQPKGLTAALRRRLLDHCGDDLRGLRDRVLIALGYDSLCRRSELVAIRVEDITELEDGSGAVLIRRSKTDQTGQGRYGFASAETLAAIARWQEAADLEEGPLFRVIRGARPAATGLHSYSVTRIIKQTAEKAGLGPAIVSELSGHSMRIGAAVDMAEHGIDLIPIMQAGGWKSAEMVLRYTEQIDIRRSGMARLHALQGCGSGKWTNF